MCPLRRRRLTQRGKAAAHRLSAATSGAQRARAEGADAQNKNCEAKYKSLGNYT